MNYYAIYNDYRIITIWKEHTNILTDNINYIALIKIYNINNFDGLNERLLVTKNNYNIKEIHDKILLFYSKSSLQVRSNIASSLDWEFKILQVWEAFNSYLFKRKLNSKNVEKFLFAELI